VKVGKAFQYLVTSSQNMNEINKLGFIQMGLFIQNSPPVLNKFVVTFPSAHPSKNQ
jgi:hypothetical protein